LEKKAIGRIKRVVGPVVEIEGVTGAQMAELVEVGPHRLIGEIIRLHGDMATTQVYEDTTSLRPGQEVWGSGMPLSVELGPGLLGTIFDGVQRRLEVIRDTSNQYIQKGVHVSSLDREKRWHFRPTATPGQDLQRGQIIGTVQETEVIEHRVMLPPDVQGKLERIAAEGEYSIEEEIATVSTGGKSVPVRLTHRWPVRKQRPYVEKQGLSTPLLTGLRVIDMLFPLARGGAVTVPGGFGTGKTLIQHSLAKWCDADIVVFIGCGERGNEITDMLIEFPRLTDPRTGKSMMQRSIIIANTSNMPVAAREASIYTGIALAEYYRDMGYHVAVMADSTSRWAEALRELSGRMEEMPADEGFPAYLPSRLAEFYERAGMVQTCSGQLGSVTTIGSVSPPGGDFSEPVTQHTKRFVRCFWALDRQLANARHYPAIGWLESYSEYTNEVSGWWHENVARDWLSLRNEVMELLQREARLQHVVKLVGPDVLPDSQKIVLETCALLRNAFLQQSAFDRVDMFSVPEKQVKMLRIILTFYRKGLENIKKGATMVRLRRIKVYPEILRMKSVVSADRLELLDELQGKLDRALDQLGAVYEQTPDAASL
jgi:V/A-type H+-transporting ATPase subunit A